MAKTLKADTSVTYPLLVAASAAATEGLLFTVNSSSQAVLADNTTPTRAVGFAIKGISASESASGKPVVLVSRGIVEVAAADIVGSWTVGALVYLATAGKYTTVKPTTNGVAAQPVGWALSSERVWVDVAPSGLLVQTAGNSNIGI